MEYLSQLSKRKNLSIHQKFEIVILLLIEFPHFVFKKINNYFGIESISDKIWFYGFYSFCGLATLFCWLIAH